MTTIKRAFKLFFVMFCFLPFSVLSQDYSTDELFEMDLADLMEIQVVSASKKLESLFDSPLSTSVLTRNEIINAGVTSIPEALRLVPGIIVREQTNGNYDIHIRGNDYLPNGYRTENAINNNSLIMIDNRIIFSNFQGGIFWETLPIGITDIERIEIIRGPSSALYGPNAVNGVIHIITTKVDKEGLSVHANGQAGNQGVITGSVTSDYGVSESLGIQVSGNYAIRDRFEDSYYSWSRNKFYPYDSLSSMIDGEDPGEYFPEALKSLNKYGINGAVYYDIKEGVSLEVSGGIQQSESQSPYVEGDFGLNTRSSNMTYMNLNSNINDLSIHAAFNTGDMDLVAGFPSLHYDEDRFEFNTEYDLSIGDFTFRPGVSYQSSSYTTDPYTDDDSGIIQGTKKINNLAFSLRSDYRLTENTRFILAYRADKYNVPDDIYHSYQFITTQKIADKHLLRGVYSRANQGAFIDFSYLNLESDITAPNGQVMGSFTIAGSQDLDLRTTDMFELDLRSKWSDNLSTDLELFYTHTENYIGNDVTEMQSFFGGAVMAPARIEYMNIDLEANQIGATVNVNYMPLDNTMIRFWVTLQETQLKNYAPDPMKLDSTINMEHKYTPSVYGGVMVDYRPVDQFSLNLNAFYTGETSFNKAYTEYGPGGTTLFNINIPGYTVLNARASYDLTDKIAVFANARNMLAQERQYAFGEKIKGVYLLGLNVNL